VALVIRLNVHFDPLVALQFDWCPLFLLLSFDIALIGVPQKLYTFNGLHFQSPSMLKLPAALVQFIERNQIRGLLMSHQGHQVWALGHSIQGGYC